MVSPIAPPQHLTHQPQSTPIQHRNPTSLDSLPTDVLTIIADDLATLHTRGPPSAVFAGLLPTCSSIAATASPHLSSLVFRAQFDIDAIKRRLPGRVTPTILQTELRRRWRALKRIRWAASAGPSVWGGSLYDPISIRDDMWVAFLLLLENDGKNWEQLVGWAMLPAYIQAYLQWDLVPVASGDELPEETEIRSLGMWLLWFLSDDRNLTREIDRHPRLMRLIKPMAFASYAYANDHLPWYLFDATPDDIASVVLPPTPRPLTPLPTYIRPSSFDSYLDAPLRIAPPLISEAAIHLTFIKVIQPPLQGSVVPASPPAFETFDNLWDSTQYDAEWTRLVTPSSVPWINAMPSSGFRYVPGSFTGVFEGTFILPGLDTHQRIMNGESALTTFDSAYCLGHKQAWRLEEFVFDRSSPGTDVAINRPGSMAPRRVTCTGPINPGPALAAHLPEDLTLERVRGGVLASAHQRSAFYRTWHRPQTYVSESEEELEPEVDDIEDGCVEIIVTGEAIEPHAGLLSNTMMAPGSVVTGTIRRKDGLITLWAHPLQEGSGEWLYIGRLSADGSWVGRWRSLQDDATAIVPEGIFRMQRR